MTTDSSDLWAAALNTLSEEDRKSVAFDDLPKLEVLSDLEQLVASTKESSIKKRWRFHRSGSGQTVILRDLFSKIAVWIDRFKEVGDIVVQFDPVHAALPWAGVRFLLQAAVSDINIFAFVVEGAETVSRCISRFATFEQIYLKYGNRPSRAIKVLEEALVKLYAAILIYLGRAKKYFEEHTPKRMAKAVALSQKDFETLLRNIDNELANVDRYARLVDAERGNDISDTLVDLSADYCEVRASLWELLQSIDSPICRMSRQLDDVKDQVNYSERVKILEWLSSQPYKDHHRQIKKKALQGSGQWLLQDPLYIQWYKQSVSSLLWLRGKPGSGKSTLVSIVIEDMIQKFEAGQSPLPVYFYCTRSAAEPERSKPNVAFASILRQLTCSHPDTPFLTPVIKMYKNRGEGFKSNGLDLEESRDLIIKLIENYAMTVIVVDALDESDPQLRQSLLDAFEYILKESAGLVKIFVSSRNDQDIVYTLREYPNLYISSDRNTADIKTYVNIETRRLVRSRQLLRNSSAKEEMAKLIIERLSSGADGMFRWVSLQLDVLRALKRDEDIRTRLGKLPRELEQLYHEVYSNLITDQDEIGRSIINNTLKWLLCAREEMSASIFLHAVAANLDTDGDITIDSLLDLCNNLVIYDESLNMFRFAHLSVREFLEQRQGFEELSCYIVAAESCLLQIIASSNCPGIEHLMSNQQVLRLRRSPGFTDSSSSASFIEYAGNYWRHYCQKIPLSARSDDTSLGRIFWVFFSKELRLFSPLESWVQWRCNHARSFGDSGASFKLQRLLITHLDCLSRSFLVASYYGFIDIVKSYLRDPKLSGQMKDQALLLAIMNAQHKVFDIFVEEKRTLTVTKQLLLHAAKVLDKRRLESLLDQAAETIVPDLVFATMTENLDDWDSGKVTMLLDRYPSLKVGVRALEAAIGGARLETFKLLVARAAKPSLTEHMLLSMKPDDKLEKSEYIEKIMILLNTMRESDLTPNLIAVAAKNSSESVLEMILERTIACNITEIVMIEALLRGIRTFNLTLKHGGQVTDAVLDRAASRCGVEEWQTLLEQAHQQSIDVKRLRLAANNPKDHYGVLSMLLDHADDLIPVNDMADLICHVVRTCRGTEQLRQLLKYTKDVTISQEMLWAATLNSNIGRLVRIEMLLERSSELEITEDMLIVAACDGYAGVDLLTLFLGRENEDEMSEYVLLAAVSNWQDGVEIMRLLLEHERAASWATYWTGDVLACAAQNLSPDLVLNILKRSGVDVTTQLLEAAATNWYHGDVLVEVLLARADLHVLLEDVFVEAVANWFYGIEVIHVLEGRFGQIDLTERLMVKCVRRATNDTIDFLLSRTKPAQITHKVLVSAIENQVYGQHDVKFRVAEKSLHIPITIDILESAAEYGDLDLFRFLWNQCRRSSVPEDLFNAASRNRSYTSSLQIMKFLLDEAEWVEIGEKSLASILSCWNDKCVCEMLDVLLEQGLQADSTEHVAKTLLMDEGIQVKCSISKKLRLRENIKVNEDMFRIAASLGHERVLEKLTDFCQLGSTRKEWLDIARLHKAVTFNNENLLKSLIAHGVDPDVADPYGNTPLLRAVEVDSEVMVQMLLSAGSLPNGGPKCKESPLCEATRRGCFEIAKILVDAGASIDFVNDQGKTPAVLAKENGHILVFKYLEQCKLKQAKAGREASGS